MANFSRFILFVVLFFCVGISFADIPKNPKYLYYVAATTFGTYDSFDAACEGYRVYKLGIQPASSIKEYIFQYSEVLSEDAAKCYFNYHGSPTMAWQALRTAVSGSCPDHSYANGENSCVCESEYDEKDGQCRPKNPCPEGQHEEGGACVPDNCKEGEIRVNSMCVPDPDNCPDGKPKVNGKCKEDKCERDKPLMLSTGNSMPTALCENRCVYMISNALVCNQGGPGDGCFLTYYSTGASCNEPPGSSGDGGGGSGGDNNGGSGGGDNNGGSGGNNNGGSGGNNNGGGGSGPSRNGNNIPGKDPNSDGKCPADHYMSGGKCYPNKPDEKPPTGGSGNSGSGSGSGTSGDGTGSCPDKYTLTAGRCIANQPPPDDDRDRDFCKENPDLTMCKPGTFGGSCGAFNCEGDAIQCAIAQEQHQRNCKLFDDPPDSVFTAAVDGSDGLNTDKLKSEAQQVSVGSFDENGFGWGSACPSDPEIDLGFTSQSISIPFSRICGPLSVLSLAGVGITLLGCLLWVLGGRKQ